MNERQGVNNRVTLRVSDLRVRFEGPNGVTGAVNGIGYELREGESLAIVGESGSGKTVSVLAPLRLLPQANVIASGAFVFRGQDLMATSEKELRSILGKDIGLVYQDPMSSLNPAIPIGKQIAEAFVTHGTRRREARHRAIEGLARVGIPEPEKRYGHYPHELSGGQRQRVMIAMAIANAPALIVADEPTTALDVTIQAQILALLKEAVREANASLIIITHDFGVVAEVASRVLVMYAGRVVESGSAADVLHRPLHPYTQALIRSIPDLETVRERLPSIEGLPPNAASELSGCPFAPRCPLRRDRCEIDAPTLDLAIEDQSVACHYWREAADRYRALETAKT